MAREGTEGREFVLGTHSLFLLGLSPEQGLFSCLLQTGSVGAGQGTKRGSVPLEAAVMTCSSRGDLTEGRRGAARPLPLPHRRGQHARALLPQAHGSVPPTAPRKPK